MQMIIEHALIKWMVLVHFLNLYW